MLVLRWLLKIVCAPILVLMMVIISTFIFLLVLSTLLFDVFPGLIGLMGLPAAAGWLLDFMAKLRESIRKEVF